VNRIRRAFYPAGRYFLLIKKKRNVRYYFSLIYSFSMDLNVTLMTLFCQLLVKCISKETRYFQKNKRNLLIIKFNLCRRICLCLYYIYIYIFYVDIQKMRPFENRYEVSTVIVISPSNYRKREI